MIDRAAKYHAENFKLFHSWLKPSVQVVNDIVIRDLTPTHILVEHDKFLKLLRDSTK